MTENSTSNSLGTEPTRGENTVIGADPVVGADKIDTYLNSVERVLLSASCAKSERLQILEDLELQITEMLNREPLPFTEETVESVIARLAPASHFAAIYGPQSDEPRSPVPVRPTTIPYNPSAVVAAISFALIPLSCVLLLCLASVHVIGAPIALMVILLLAGTIVTPAALRKAFNQLRAEPLRQQGRDLAIATMVGYVATVPMLLLVLACLATDGYILFPLAVASFIYFQWLLIRRLRQRIDGAIPTQPTTKSFKNPLWRFFSPAQTAPCV